MILVSVVWNLKTFFISMQNYVSNIFFKISSKLLHGCRNAAHLWSTNWNWPITFFHIKWQNIFLHFLISLLTVLKHAHLMITLTICFLRFVQINKAWIWLNCNAIENNFLYIIVAVDTTYVNMLQMTWTYIHLKFYGIIKINIISFIYKILESRELKPGQMMKIISSYFLVA